MSPMARRRVVGQGEAVGAVADAIVQARAGLATGERPLGSFLFVGPTGVGIAMGDTLILHCLWLILPNISLGLTQ